MFQIGDKVVHPMYGAGVYPVIGQLRDVDQTVHTGNHLGKGAEGHQLDDAHVGGGPRLRRASATPER